MALLRRFARVGRIAAFILAAALLPRPLRAQSSDAPYIERYYVKRELRIAMRDGTELFTAVYSPKDASPTRRYPIVLLRTPFSVAPYGEKRFPAHLGPDPFMLRDGYIFVNQDVRGRYMSGGTFVNVRPLVDDSSGARTRAAADEATDAFDTIDWLIRHVPGNNGRVGVWGMSYPGFYAAMSALSGHPALAAVAPEAPVTDLYFEDFHHNGAFTLGEVYGFPVFGVPRGAPTTKDWWLPAMVAQPSADDYHDLLAMGPLSVFTTRYYSRNTLWRDVVAHPDYDWFWQARALSPHLRGSLPPLLNVGGWFDAEDLYGPLDVHRAVQRQQRRASKSSIAARDSLERSVTTSRPVDASRYNGLVMGPFRHGGWERTGIVHTVHGDIYFGDSLETRFQRDVEAKFFHHFLKDPAGSFALPNALMFDTGDKRWRSFDAWPANSAVRRRLYLGSHGTLSFDAPSETAAYDEYVSDPSHPVPSRCHGATIEDYTLYHYMSDDQRCFDSRSDVLTYETAPLASPLTVGGELEARLFVSTSGTDADYVVKLIDVYPPREPDSPYRPDTSVHYAGYQQLVRGEIMRGRYRNGFDAPRPFVAGVISEVSFHLQDILHTFKPGHRIMVQIQSSWFPAFDRNPQRYVPNIYQAAADDFIKATERVYRDRGHPSGLSLQVLPP